MPTRAAVLCLVMVTATTWLSAQAGSTQCFVTNGTHAMQAYEKRKRKTSAREYDHPFVFVRRLQTARFPWSGAGANHVRRYIQNGRSSRAIACLCYPCMLGREGGIGLLLVGQLTDIFIGSARGADDWVFHIAGLRDVQRALMPVAKTRSYAYRTRVPWVPRLVFPKCFQHVYQTNL